MFKKRLFIILMALVISSAQVNALTDKEKLAVEIAAPIGALLIGSAIYKVIARNKAKMADQLNDAKTPDDVNKAMDAMDTAYQNELLADLVNKELAALRQANLPTDVSTVQKEVSDMISTPEVVNVVKAQAAQAELSIGANPDLVSSVANQRLQQVVKTDTLSLQNDLTRGDVEVVKARIKILETEGADVGKILLGQDFQAKLKDFGPDNIREIVGSISKIDPSVQKQLFKLASDLESIKSDFISKIAENNKSVYEKEYGANKDLVEARMEVDDFTNKYARDFLADKFVSAQKINDALSADNIVNTFSQNKAELSDYLKSKYNLSDAQIQSFEANLNKVFSNSLKDVNAKIQTELNKSGTLKGYVDELNQLEVGPSLKKSNAQTDPFVQKLKQLQQVSEVSGDEAAKALAKSDGKPVDPNQVVADKQIQIDKDVQNIQSQLKQETAASEALAKKLGLTNADAAENLKDYSYLIDTNSNKVYEIIDGMPVFETDEDGVPKVVEFAINDPRISKALQTGKAIHVEDARTVINDSIKSNLKALDISSADMSFISKDINYIDAGPKGIFILAEGKPILNVTSPSEIAKIKSSGKMVGKKIGELTKAIQDGKTKSYLDELKLNPDQAEAIFEGTDYIRIFDNVYVLDKNGLPIDKLSLKNLSTGDQQRVKDSVEGFRKKYGKTGDNLTETELAKEFKPVASFTLSEKYLPEIGITQDELLNLSGKADFLEIGNNLYQLSEGLPISRVGIDQKAALLKSGKIIIDQNEAYKIVKAATNENLKELGLTPQSQDYLKDESFIESADGTFVYKLENGLPVAKIPKELALEYGMKIEGAIPHAEINAHIAKVRQQIREEALSNLQGQVSVESPVTINKSASEIPGGPQVGPISEPTQNGTGTQSGEPGYEPGEEEEPVEPVIG